MGKAAALGRGRRSGRGSGSGSGTRDRFPAFQRHTLSALEKRFIFAFFLKKIFRGGEGEERSIAFQHFNVTLYQPWKKGLYLHFFTFFLFRGGEGEERSIAFPHFNVALHQPWKKGLYWHVPRVMFHVKKGGGYIGKKKVDIGKKFMLACTLGMWGTCKYKPFFNTLFFTFYRFILACTPCNVACIVLFCTNDCSAQMIVLHK